MNTMLSSALHSFRAAMTFLASWRLCLPSEIHDSEERSVFNRGVKKT